MKYVAYVDRGGGFLQELLLLASKALPSEVEIIDGFDIYEYQSELL